MDFVFDRIASGRTLKCLAIVDDATHEAVAVAPEHTIGGDHLTRILDGRKGHADLGASQSHCTAPDRTR
jgi:hypothetical protein